MTEPVVWVKHKYVTPKDKGRYKGGTSASVKAVRKRKKVGGGPGPFEYVMVISSEGSPKWISRPREGQRK